MNPRFKLDENLPIDAKALLRDHGFDVETALAEGLGGGADRVILDACRTEGRVLVTLDLDFADIRGYPPADHRGIWVLRPLQQSVQGIVALIQGAVKLLATEKPEGRLLVVERDRIRIRE